CFAIYDLEDDGAISKKNASLLLNNCLIKQNSDDDSDEAHKELISILFKILDVDDDGKINKKDYEDAVKRDELLLECLGQCLPSNEALKSVIEQINQRA
ncbi:MAG: EF-hand calcium-binding domain-containing protein 1, partial [Paramarteilia canceri]